MDTAHSQVKQVKRKSHLHFLDLSFSLLTTHFEPWNYYKTRDYIFGIFSVSLIKMSCKELHWCFCCLTSIGKLPQCLQAPVYTEPARDLPIQILFPGPYLFITTVQVTNNDLRSILLSELSKKSYQLSLKGN